MAQSESNMPFFKKWELAMQKLLGVELQKVWLCWTIFVIKIVCAPLNLIFGGIFYNESSEQPHLPPLMIAGGLLEVPWVLLAFFLYVMLPYKRIQGGTGEKSRCALNFLHLLFLLLSLGLGIVMVWMTLLLAGVNTYRVNFNCQPDMAASDTCTTIPRAVFYGGWVTVGFKYLDTVKFFFVFFTTFKHNDK